MPNRVPLILVAALLVAACSPPRPSPVPSPQAAPPDASEQLGELLDFPRDGFRLPDRDLLGTVEYDLPVEANLWVEAELDFLVGQRREVIGRWLERGDPYEHHVKQVLREHHLPTDLFHLAMIESGFVPTARSRAGAVGLWQFMPSTGRASGLRVDAQVDERMDPVRSTRAAARHLRSLYGAFGDWALAAAAYNAGSGRISRGLRAAGATNFWDLALLGDLAEETRHYVPRLYAMTIIARDRARFGFPPPADQRLALDSVRVDYETPLAELASMADGLMPGQLERLNPHLLARSAPAAYWVWVPSGMGATLQGAYMASDFRKQRGYGEYAVRRGDFLGRIAERSGVGARRIRELNPGVNFDPLPIGTRLKLPYQAVQQLKAANEMAAAAPPPEPRTVKPAKPAKAVARAESATPAAREHVVRGGETLWGIAERYGIDVAALQSANALSGAVIRPGQTLRVPEGSRGKAASAEHVVQGGETLWGIARRYGLEVEALQAANRIANGHIVPGQTLVIPR